MSVHESPGLCAFAFKKVFAQFNFNQKELMKVVILAAGLGSRLDTGKNHRPKALTTLSNGQSILQYQVDALTRYVNKHDLLVVVGYQLESIMKAFPTLTYIHNNNYAHENTSKSLLKALSNLDEDLLWLNGDVIFQHQILKQLIEANRTAMVVNKSVVGEEEVKYRADPNGRILEVSKHVSNPHGEALGINFMKRGDLSLLRHQLEQCLPNDYFEKAIEEAIKQDDLAVWAVPVDNDQCIEIDFPEDLESANHLLQTWRSYA